VACPSDWFTVNVFTRQHGASRRITRGADIVIQEVRLAVPRFSGSVPSGHVAGRMKPESAIERAATLRQTARCDLGISLVAMPGCPYLQVGKLAHPGGVGGGLGLEVGDELIGICGESVMGLDAESAGEMFLRACRFELFNPSEHDTAGEQPGFAPKPSSTVARSSVVATCASPELPAESSRLANTGAMKESPLEARASPGSEGAKASTEASASSASERAEASTEAASSSPGIRVLGPGVPITYRLCTFRRTGARRSRANATRSQRETAGDEVAQAETETETEAETEAAAAAEIVSLRSVLLG